MGETLSLLFTLAAPSMDYFAKLPPNCIHPSLQAHEARSKVLASRESEA